MPRHANTSRMMASLKGLHRLMNTIEIKGSEMSSPSADSTLVTLKQSDIDGWAKAIESAVQVISAVIKGGNLQAADETAMQQAMTDLQGAMGSVPQTPPTS